MFCYKCGCELGRTDHCPNCGSDVATYKKIIYTSNYLYNDGLEKAKVRDLSGAILSLKNSLWYNKDNLDARNLLGLIYYELGETVAALAEWVISKNINDERLHRKQNPGASYLEQVQASKQTMDNLDSSIERYNQALECCYTDNLDVAVLQLKKVLQINPHYLRARQLLSLLYIEAGQHRRAYRELQKCLRLDVSNTTTLRYLQEVESVLGLENNSMRGADASQQQHTVRTVKTAGPEPSAPADTGKRTGKRKKEKLKAGSVIKYTDGNETIIQPVNARNPGVDGFGIPSWIYGGIIGLIVGAALVSFLVMPARVQMIRTDSQNQIREISEEVASKEADISELEAQTEDLSEQIAAYEEELAAATAVTQEDPFTVKANALMSSAAYYIEDSVDISNAVAAMEQILPSEASEDVTEEFTQLYEQLYPLLRAQILQDHADLGIAAYEAAEPDYETAVTELTFANEFEDPDNPGTTWTQRQYYLADSCYQLYLEDPYAEGAEEYVETARSVIENLIETQPDSQYAALGEELLSQLPETAADDTQETGDTQETVAE